MSKNSTRTIIYHNYVWTNSIFDPILAFIKSSSYRAKNFITVPMPRTTNRSSDPRKFDNKQWNGKQSTYFDWAEECQPKCEARQEISIWIGYLSELLNFSKVWKQGGTIKFIFCFHLFKAGGWFEFQSLSPLYTF